MVSDSLCALANRFSQLGCGRTLPPRSLHSQLHRFSSLALCLIAFPALPFVGGARGLNSTRGIRSVMFQSNKHPHLNFSDRILERTLCSPALRGPSPPSVRGAVYSWPGLLPCPGLLSLVAHLALSSRIYEIPRSPRLQIHIQYAPLGPCAT
ncbi:hypothetical protein C8R43DRAFT_612244 [Mycena crocata]|nr:hypothetical protein C8R43DRAFT_612244 [Mycena crocata]